MVELVYNFGKQGLFSEEYFLTDFFFLESQAYNDNRKHIIS